MSPPILATIFGLGPNGAEQFYGTTGEAQIGNISFQRPRRPHPGVHLFAIGPRPAFSIGQSL